MAAKPPEKFLFICTGNICRSLMAEKLLQRLAAERGLPWEARSCGIAAERHYQVPPEIKEILKREGLPEFQHTAQLVGRELLRWCDVALALTEEHREVVVDMFPEFRFKVHILRPFAGLKDEPDVEDPMGLAREDYELAAARIKEALERLIRSR